jgi:hypothetical protein
MLHGRPRHEAYERLLKADVKYRFVIDMASLKEAGDTKDEVGATEEVTT